MLTPLDYPHNNAQKNIFVHSFILKPILNLVLKLILNLILKPVPIPIPHNARNNLLPVNEFQQKLNITSLRNIQTETHLIQWPGPLLINLQSEEQAITIGVFVVLRLGNVQRNSLWDPSPALVM
jgi:hypothetical protein